MRKKGLALLTILFFVILFTSAFAQSSAPADQGTPPGPGYGMGPGGRYGYGPGYGMGPGYGARRRTGDDGPGLRLCTRRRAVLS